MALSSRDALSFPLGDNATDSLINGIHFNTTTLTYWNYTLFTNNTISNSSQCYLIFDNYKPVLLTNGTWIYNTSCYTPVLPIGLRAQLGIAFAVLFGLVLLATMANLKKHGQQFLKEEKRFRLVGRRWSWYWCLFTCACGIVSAIVGVDVDRDYLQDTPILLQSFFYYLMYPGILAAVWESVRHWGSWQERQIVDSDQYAFRDDDRRARAEFYLPLIFYLFAWLEFFMTIPRSWTAIRKQSSPEMQLAIAAPAATDSRFKAGAIIATVAFIIVYYMLGHSLHYYKPRAHGFLGGIKLFRFSPLKFQLVLPVLGVRVLHGILSAWDWEMSIMKFNGNPAWAFGMGYAPVLVVMGILNIAGAVEVNEDRVLIQQRAARGRDTDAELGIVTKPGWWRRGEGERYLSDEARLKNLASEVGGGRRNTTEKTTQTRHAGGEEGRVPPPGPPPAYEESNTDEAVSPGIGKIVLQREIGRRGSNASDGTSGSKTSIMTGTTLQSGAGLPTQPRYRSMLDV